jgi:pyruvate-formate lyase-activating enzyme
MKRDAVRFGLLSLGVFACALGVAFSSAPQAAKKKTTVDFNRDVRPILAKSCWTCHGPDPEPLKKTGNMRLDSFAGATEDRGGYRAIVAGQPAKSMMLDRISGPEATRMPPVSSGLKALTKQEVQILRTWIAEGAEYRAHWAFVPPKPPTLPSVVDKAWVRNPIDLFVLKQLEEAKIKPEPQADRATTVRRVSLTLTGLPPTPAETDAFLADTKPGAYERMVERFLSSPRYGEHQARYWLDAVRYADTHGLHIDNERAVYPYRDWVVRAFNEDLPFDQFATWQIAGDLLKNPTIDQKIATGYVRMNPTTNEGGVIEAEVLAMNTMDRVDTTSTVFMGVTMGCAKCHDHKYDPFTAKDYYSMYAFFNSTKDAPLDGNARIHEPVMKAPTSAQAAQLEKWSKQLADILDKTPLEEARTWGTTSAPQLPALGAWELAGPYTFKTFDEAFDNEVAEKAWKPVKVELDKGIAFSGKENSATYVRTTVTVSKAGKFEARFSSDDGIKIWVNGNLVHSNKLLRAILQSTDTVALELKAGQNELLAKVTNSGGGDGFYISIGDAKSRSLSRANELAVKGGLTGAESLELKRLYRELGPDSANTSRYRKTASEHKKLDEAIPITYIAEELPMPREARLLKRGSYATPGEKVDRAIPKVFGTLPLSLPKNRLGLANWLTDPKNPLTSRVFVNRVWQQHFGVGLVASAEDFGSRGDWPTHPELLDYLAVRFMQEGWSLKQLHRLILNSAAWRQSASAGPDKRAKDPENKLYSRGPRFRLDAEVVRDTALYVSGLLVERPGGKGDKPYQPSGLWEAIAYPISDTARYMQDHGDALYRRSLYLFWKRTSPPPTMLLFDAPMRESCVVRRSTTNTPTQALATLNETGFVEASRAFAQRVLKTTFPKPPADRERARLSVAFRLATGRTPSAPEQAVMLDLLRTELAGYRANPLGAIKAVSIGESKRDATLDPAEHAAWMVVCNLILNLDETLTQH